MNAQMKISDSSVQWLKETGALPIGVQCNAAYLAITRRQPVDILDESGELVATMTLSIEERPQP